MAIYREIMESADRAQEMADARYPVPEFDFSNADEYHAQQSRNFEYGEVLERQAHADLAHKHILSIDSLGSIMMEGIEKGWPH